MYNGKKLNNDTNHKDSQHKYTQNYGYEPHILYGYSVIFSEYPTATIKVIICSVDCTI